MLLIGDAPGKQAKERSAVIMAVPFAIVAVRKLS